MKNSIKIIGALALILSVTFACKKSEKPTKDEKDQKFSVAIKKGTFEGNPENAVIIGTKAELETTFSGKSETIYLKKVADMNNLFVDVTGTVSPADPVNPMDMCWDEINAYYQNHYEEWQNTANETCKPVITCITCPKSGGGLYVMYVIKPTSPKCNIAVATAQLYNFSQFNFGESDYNSDAVSAYVNVRK